MPDPHPRGGPAEERLARLDALAAELTARGWTAYVTTPLGRPARLFVQNPHDLEMCADIMTAPENGTGGWWFWFSWAERIAPVGSPDAAATVIVTELRRPVDVRWERTPGSHGHRGRRRAPRFVIHDLLLRGNHVAARFDAQFRHPESGPG
ncbi:MAG: hypothetical protein J2P30_12445 [Actinobacteria bacterium]|nr:hypothetical protein [Actinomycetota bacterium]